MLARKQHVPNIARLPKTTLHTCCDLSEEALAECKDVHGALNITKDFKAAVNDPEVEAICVATTESFRLPIIIAAAEANKPVYCEKPIAATLEEMYEIQKIVNEAGIPFCVGHNRRCSPAMAEAHRVFRGHMTNPKPCPWRYDREGPKRLARDDDGVAAMSVRINDDWYSWKYHAFGHKYGPILFEMTHFTDLCNWLLAAEPESVVAMETGFLNHGIVVKYKTGEMATLMMTANGTFGYPKELYEMFGNGGAVVVDHMCEIRTAGIDGVEPKITFPFLKDRHENVGVEGGISGWLAKKQVACKEAAQAGDSKKIFTAEPNKGHANAIDMFVDQIRGQGPVVCSLDDAVAATRIAFAAIKSAQENRLVHMSEV